VTSDHERINEKEYHCYSILNRKGISLSWINKPILKEVDGRSWHAKLTKKKKKTVARS
jgi:hypothetical protein